MADYAPLDNNNNNAGKKMEPKKISKVAANRE